MRLVILYSDVLMWALVPLIALGTWRACRSPELRARWRRVLLGPVAQACATLLAVFLLIALVDSVHYRGALATPDGMTAHDTRAVSLLDSLVLPRIAARERSYSAPFALHDFDKTPVTRDGRTSREFQRLSGASGGLEPAAADRLLIRRSLQALGGGVLALALAWGLAGLVTAWRRRLSWRAGLRRARAAARPAAAALTVLQLLFLLAVWLALCWPLRHVLGTDATGNDVLYTALKSVRTAIVIGSLATVSALPFAVVLGIAAGYLKGWVDDLIQYVYTTLSSIPSVLLIAAVVLLLQVFIDKNPQLYETSLERADLRLFMLAVIIGVTGWASLARLLRAETLKVSALDFVAAARAFGVSPAAIMWRHVLPNTAHIVLIVAVLDFSGIVLYEAVLSYVGVGVDPAISSFGTMITAAAQEMSRSPVIWWNLAASFAFMLTMVLSANLFASAVRDVFDPRSAQGGIARAGEGGDA